MDTETLSEELSIGGATVEHSASETVLVDNERGIGSAAHVTRLLMLAGAVVVPLAVVRSADYAVAMAMPGLLALLAILAAVVDSLKVRAYTRPPYLKARRVVISPSKAGYRSSGGEAASVVVDGYAGGIASKVMTTLTEITVTAGGRQNVTRRLHVALVLANTVARVASFPGDEPTTAGRFAKALAIAAGVPSPNKEPVFELALEHTTGGYWGLALVTLCDMASFVLIAWLLSPSGHEFSVVRVVLPVVAWIAVHVLLQRVLLRGLRNEMADTARARFGFGVPAGSSAKDTAA